MLDIHPSARDNFDTRAEALIPLLRTYPQSKNSSGLFPKEAHISAQILEKDIVNFTAVSSVDSKGRTTGRYFPDGKGRVGLELVDYEKFRSVAEAVQSSGPIRSTMSKKYVEDKLILWLQQRFNGDQNHNSFISFLERLAKSDIAPITVYVPLAYTTVEEKFNFCGAVIQNISKAMLDESAPDPSKEGYEEVALYWEKVRAKFQGYAAIRIDLTCEPDFAVVASLEKARKIADLLGIYSVEILAPDEKSISKIKGNEYISQWSVFKGQGEKLHSSASGFDSHVPRVRTITASDIARYRDCGFDVLSSIVLKKMPSKFEEVVLTMAYLYSKAVYTSEPMEKIVYILSALESTLLKDNNESIQQNLAERIAIFISNELFERREIIKNVKAVYALRSRYLHHGILSEELGVLEKFLRNTWCLFVNLVNNSKQFQTKELFLNHLDDLKLAGTKTSRNNSSQYRWV